MDAVDCGFAGVEACELGMSRGNKEEEGGKEEKGREGMILGHFAVDTRNADSTIRYLNYWGKRVLVTDHHSHRVSLERETAIEKKNLYMQYRLNVSIFYNWGFILYRVQNIRKTLVPGMPGTFNVIAMLYYLLCRERPLVVSMDILCSVFHIPHSRFEMHWTRFHDFASSWLPP